MKQITIRNIPDEIEKIILKEAKTKSLSLNKAFILFLEKAAGSNRTKKKKISLHHDLDHLSGVWSKKEAESFNHNLESQRTLDEDLWTTAK